MKRLIFSAAAMLVVSGCATSSSGLLPPLPATDPVIVEQGTLANEVLAKDVVGALYQVNGGKKKISRYVVHQPVGEIGKKAWREMWVYDPDGLKRKFIITFEEDGTGSADYEIKSM